MNESTKLVPVTLKVLGVLWGATAAYLLYGVYGNWVMIQHYANKIAKEPELGREFYQQAVFFGIIGALGLVVTVGLVFFRPHWAIWWLALLLCPGTSWWFLSQVPHLLHTGSYQGLLIFLSLLALYAFTFVYLLLPSLRAAFGIGQHAVGGDGK